MNRETRRSVLRFVALGLLLLLNGCDGGGDSPTEPQSGILFTPDSSAGSNSVILRKVGGTSTTLELEIFATELNDVQSLLIGLTYPTDLLQFNGHVQGEFLNPSIPVVLTVFDTVLITQTRLSPGGVSGSGRIGTLTFSALAEGTGRIDFFDPQALDPDGQEIAGVDWIGGGVQVTF